MILRLIGTLAVALVFSLPAAAREQIRIVGSSTVFPFATEVAEKFVEKTDFPAPVIEVTGSGEGFDLFCDGLGAKTPDITNASRRITAAEWDQCNENGVTDLIEVKLGFDGIVIGSASSGPDLDLAQVDLYKALAGQVFQYGRLDTNPFRLWSDVTTKLPATPIRVIGPQATSGTREAFEELAIQKGARLSGLGEDAASSVTLRKDGVYVEATDDDNLVLSQLQADPTVIGIVGYSFLVRYPGQVKGARIDSVEPTFENIADGTYPLARSMFMYVKYDHIGIIPGLEEYLEEFMSDAATGETGYTVERGLIPLAEDERAEATAAAANLAVMTGEEQLQ